jgi:hypothetical protein
LLYEGELLRLTDQILLTSTPVHPRAAMLEMQDYERGSEARIVVAEPVVAVRRQLGDGANAPDPCTRLRRRQERRELQVADAVGAILVRCKS